MNPEEFTEIEPKDYFEDLKTKVNRVQMKQIEDNQKFLANELEKASRLGQKNLSHRSAYMWQILEREMILVGAGYEDYVYREDVVKFIDKVKPANSVKIVELENFPRVIPDENVAAIEDARDLGIFDLLVVVYTDFTNEEVNSPEQKELVNRNRDPIVFGMFLNDKIDLKHDRMYLITDWEDEYCDLTFTKMLDRMTEQGMENPGKKITVDTKHINALVSDNMAEIAQIKDVPYSSLPKKEKRTWISRLTSYFSNDTE